jgi:hypothetical protein
MQQKVIGEQVLGTVEIKTGGVFEGDNAGPVGIFGDEHPASRSFSETGGGGGAFSPAAKEGAVIMKAKKNAKRELRIIVCSSLVKLAPCLPAR